MTAQDLETETRDVIAAIANQVPGSRHLLLDQLHDVMGAYGRAGQATPASLRRLLEELTEEAVEARFENMPV